MTTRMSVGTDPVLATPTPSPQEQARHFGALRGHETDCWDVHASLAAAGDDAPGYVLLDVRGPDHFAAGHVPGATSLPHGRIVARNLADWPQDTLFVVYCAGPHCNGADRAALRLARLGRPVKKMIGGVTGWLDEGFVLEDADGDEVRTIPVVAP